MTSTEQAANVLRDAIYMNMATVTPEGMPWNSPVFCAYDHQLNFFWSSWKKNQHSKNLASNPNAFATFYDSTVPQGTGIGVYMKGIVAMLTDNDQLVSGLQHLHTRKRKSAGDPKRFTGPAPRRVYMFTPEQAWVNGDEEQNNQHIDIRKPISLENLAVLLR